MKYRSVSIAPAPSCVAAAYHVHVSVEGLDAAEELLVVAHHDQHLGVVLDGIDQHRQRTRAELLLLGDLVLGLGAGGGRSGGGRREAAHGVVGVWEGEGEVRAAEGEQQKRRRIAGSSSTARSPSSLSLEISRGVSVD